MSRSRDHELLVNEGREREKKYDWVAAIEPYEKALALAIENIDLSSAAKICERIGFCYHRAAMQARNVREFRSRMLETSKAYSKAAELFGKTEEPEKLAKARHCKATAAYADSWLTPDSASRKELLDERWKLEEEALRLYRGIGDRPGLGRTYVELNACLVDRLDLEWDKQIRQRMLREALNYGEKAIEVLSEFGETGELARAYYTTSIHCHTAATGLELEKKSKYAREALNYSKKAVKISEKIGDRFLLGMSNIWAGSAVANFVDRPDSASRYFEDALDCGKHTRDNYLIGRASYLLAHLMAWKMIVEEDPEKTREESKDCERYSQDAIRNFTSISNDQEIARSYYWYAENYSLLAKSAETSSKKKRALLKKSIEAGKKGLEHARRSGSTWALWFILHPLSKSLFLLSTMETEADAKKRLLEKSLQYREESIKALEQAMPYYFWNHGVYHNYLASIQAELAKIESDEERKAKLLENAVESGEKCINLCLRSKPLGQGQYATLGGYYSDFGEILGQLHLMTGSDELLGRLLEIFRGAVKTYKKAGLLSRAAESYWQLGKVCNRLRDFTESAENFESAHEQYTMVADKIPSLKEFYLNHASYMKGWSEIQKARCCHVKQEYGGAKKHYEKAASLHKSSKTWKYLVPNYLAWTKLEHGEDLSRKERSEEARTLFQQAAKLFAEAKKSIETELESIEVREEKEMAAELIKASDIRYEYCFGRTALEEARVLDRKGEYAASSRKYGSAVERFQNAVEALELESDRQEFKPIVCLCHAWEMMMRAEAEASPRLYLKASRLFDKAKEDSFDEKAKLLALGHSCFCKALEAGRRFEATGDNSLHLAATRHLEGATSYYFKAGFRRGSEYAKATQRFFDAHMYMHEAKTEINPLQKAQYYQISEKLLQASAASYKRAKKPEKGEYVRRLLKSVQEERELALSLTEALRIPSIVSTTDSFLTPNPTLEKAVGLERFEHGNVQTGLISDVKEVRLGEDFALEIQIANVGKEAVLLAEIDEIFPQGFELIVKPDYSQLRDTHLDLRGKRLEPMQIEKIKLVLKPFDKGTFEMKPRVIYVNETGHRMSSEPKPVAIDVLQVVLAGRIPIGLENVDELLLGGIPENYSVILTSPSCDEKDSLIKSFLRSGITKEQVTFLVTAVISGTKTLAEEFQSNFYLFICNPRADTIAENLPNVFKLRGVENLTEITIALTKAFSTLDKPLSGPRRACLGIVSDVLLQHHAVQTRRWLTDLIPELRSKGFTTLAVMNPQMHPAEEFQAILELFDGEISIYERETKEGSEKLLKIKRMCDQIYSKNELSLRKEKSKP